MRDDDRVGPPNERAGPVEGEDRAAGSSGSSETRHPYRRPIGRFELIIAGFAGYDPRLVARYAGEEADHERQKIFKIGLCVFIPALLALFTAYFFLGPYVEVTATRVVYSVIAALFILLVDSVVVATIAQRAGFGTLIRCLISLCMGWIISEPVLLHLYQPSVEAQIQRDLTAERAQEQASREASLAQAAREYHDLDQQLVSDQSQLEQLTPAALTARHLKEQEAQKGALLDQVRSQKERDLTALYSERAKLESEREHIQQEIESKTVEMQNESAGHRASGRVGIGGVWQSLDSARGVLKSDLKKVNQQIADLDDRIQARRNDDKAETQLNSQLDSVNTDATPSPGGGLSLAEQAEKARLTTEIEGLQTALAGNRAQQEQIRTEMLGLQQEFAIARRDDPLAQTQALYELLRDRWFLRFRVGTLFFFLFALDLVPILIKLTAEVGGYEEYLEMQRMERYKRWAPARDEHHDTVYHYGTRKVGRVFDFGATMTKGLGDSGPKEWTGASVRAAQRKTERAGLDVMDQVLKESEHAPASGKRAGVFSLVVSMVKTVLWFVRSRIHS